MTRAVAMSPLGLLCNKPPWGEMVAVDLKAGKILWRSRVGTTEDRAPLGIAFHWGTPLVNGVAITAGGLVFTGAMDAYLRAFDARSGEELWQGRLPVPGVANPMTYLWKGEQYVAIGAGGHSEFGTTHRRQRGGVPPGAAGRSALAVVAHHRPARRAVSGRGDRVCARGCVARDHGVALAPSCEICVLVDEEACRLELFERDADLLVAAPDRAALAHKMIGLDHQGKGRRQVRPGLRCQCARRSTTCFGPCSRCRRRP